MELKFDKSSPTRIMDGTTSTHSDLGTVHTDDGRIYRFHVVRFLTARPLEVGAAPYPKRVAAYAVEFFRQGRRLPFSALSAERRAVEAAFKPRVRLMAEGAL